jgi:hypothetical protein
MEVKITRFGASTHRLFLGESVGSPRELVNFEQEQC